MHARVAFAVALLLTMAGCASTTQVHQPLAAHAGAAGAVRYALAEVRADASQAPEPFLLMLRLHLERELGAQGMLAPAQAGAGAAGARELRVTVTAYRMRGDVSRALWGAFAGKDGVSSVVRITAPGSGARLGESTVSSYNVTVMSGPDSIAKAHAREITRFLAAAGGL